MSECERCDVGTGHHNGRGPGFGCRVKHTHVAPSAMPSRYRTPPLAGERVHNSWEKGMATHSSGMPFLDSNLDPIPLHTWQSQGSDYERKFAAERAVSAAPV